MLHAVVMAGGSGTRFWPASREVRPKQLLDLGGQRSMIQDTLARLGELVSPQQTLVVTNQRLVTAIQQQLPELPSDSVIGEPCKRDTAPCIGLAAALITRSDPDATMLVTPADHIIQPAEAFQRAVQQAVELVEQDHQRFVTFGIPPTYPAESFGYIERGAVVTAAEAQPAAVYEVTRFREKPNAEMAEQFLASGQFYWNSGIFVWKAAAVLAALRRWEPEMIEQLDQIANAFGTADFHQVLDQRFAAIQGKSIDYAVMEHYDNVAVIEAPFQWDDVGSWQSLSRTLGTDSDGNTITGKHLGLDTEGSIIRTDPDHLVVTVGLKDCIVVHTPDATLVANKHDEEAVRNVVKLLQERGWTEFL